MNYEKYAEENSIPLKYGKLELRPEYQVPMHIEAIKHCKETNEPAFLEASVGAGKTINIAFLAKYVADKGGKVLCLARQGELVEQNSAEAWNAGCKNSIYSASLQQKSQVYPVVFGTEGTVGNALHTDFKEWKPALIAIDECHMTDWADVVRYFKAKKDGGIKALHSELAKIDATKTDKEIKVARSIQKSTPHLIYHEGTNKVYPETTYGRILVHFMMENPKVRIVGFTGSPYRGKTAIKDVFWKHQLSQVDTMTLVSLGYLVPPAFGFGDDDHSYDLGEYKLKGEHGTEDFSAEELRAMQRKITKDESMTQKIINEVIEKTKDRNGVLITCAGQKHCQQVAECLPQGSWAIVTDKTSTQERRMILAKAKSGEIKYTIQIGCLTTGVNVPVWDTCVILRKIGSLTLLIQLIGRVLRTLKDEHLDQGIEKRDGLVLDYAKTLEDMGDIYDNPVLNKATVELATVKKNFIICPKCEGKNSPHAVRCANENSGTERCDHYFKFKSCNNCETENAPTADVCRNCGNDMVDINSRLINKAYSDDEFKPVKAMTMSVDKNKNLWVKWDFDSEMYVDGVKEPEVGYQLFPLSSDKPAVRQMWKFFVLDHVTDKAFVGKCLHGTAEEVVSLARKFEVPIEATHRINDKKKSVITRKKFKDGRRNYK